MHTAPFTGVYAYKPFHWSACRQADVVKVEIAEARSEVMAPLSAASMESYTRAYPYLVKLHMLQASFSLLHLTKKSGTMSLIPPPRPNLLLAPQCQFICTSLTCATERQKISVPLSSLLALMDVLGKVKL